MEHCGEDGEWSKGERGAGHAKGDLGLPSGHGRSEGLSGSGAVGRRRSPADVLGPLCALANPCARSLGLANPRRSFPRTEPPQRRALGSPENGPRGLYVALTRAGVSGD